MKIDTKIILLKRTDGKYKVEVRSGEQCQKYPLTDFEKVYNRLRDFYVNMDADIFITTLWRCGVPVSELHCDGSVFVYECGQTGSQWEYNRDTLRWKKVTDDR